MKRTRKSVALLTAAAFTLSAGPSYGQGASENLIFYRSALTSDTFEKDVEACVAYAENGGATDSEKGAVTAASFLLGGIIGAIATSSAFDSSQKRLLNECMFLEGYNRISVPESLDIGYSGPNGSFDSFEATRDLLEKDSLREVYDWQRAERADNLAGYQTFLKAYPDGLLAGEVKSRIVDFGGSVETASDDPLQPVEQQVAAAPASAVPVSADNADSSVAIPATRQSYDGTWGLTIQIYRTVHRDSGPDVCDLAAGMPETAEIRNGKLDMVLGHGVSTIINADIDSAGTITGRISTAGIEEGVSAFRVRAESGEIAIPFWIGSVCQGTFLLQHRPVTIAETDATLSDGQVTGAGQMASLESATGAEEQSDGHPYDGAWRLKTVMDQTRQRAYGPSLCLLSTKKPSIVRVKNGYLYFTIDGGSPTIVEADVTVDGKVDGQMNTRGYAGEVSEFKVKAREGRMTIPFRLGGSCKGKFILTHRSSVPVVAEIQSEPEPDMTPEAKEPVAESNELTATETEPVTAYNPDFPFDGVWMPSVSMDQMATLPYTPDICQKNVKLPRKVDIRGGEMVFKLGYANPTLVEGQIFESGKASGTFDTRSWAGGRQRFSADVRASKLEIPFKMGRDCKGTLILKKGKSLNS